MFRLSANVSGLVGLLSNGQCDHRPCSRERPIRVFGCLAPALTDDGITALAQCATTSLEEVHLWTATKLTDRSLVALAQHCLFLKVVWIIGGNPEITTQGLCAACKHLRRVELHGCRSVSSFDVAEMIGAAQDRRQMLAIVIT